MCALFYCLFLMDVMPESIIMEESRDINSPDRKTPLKVNSAVSSHPRSPFLKEA